MINLEMQKKGLPAITGVTESCLIFHLDAASKPEVENLAKGVSDGTILTMIGPWLTEKVGLKNVTNIEIQVEDDEKFQAVKQFYDAGTI